MIPAEHYIYIYLIIVLVLTSFKVFEYSQMISYGTQPGKNASIFGAVLLTLFMFLFIGFRPISTVFVDMTGYTQAMIDGRFENKEIRWDTNFLFQPMMGFLSSHGASPQVPIVILAAINFGATFIAMKKMFPNDVMLAMLVFFGAFTTFGGATNGLKAGCAAALFLVAIAYREKTLICMLFLIMSLGFHHSMQLPIVAFIICSFYKNTKVYAVFWLICFILAATHVTYFMGVFEGATDEHGAIYLNSEMIKDYEGKKGFRLDFILYSIAPVVVFYYALKRKRVLSENYHFLINYYLLVNGVWMLCMYAQFTNRIVGLSWLLYPVIIIYPFMKGEWGKNWPKMLAYVTLGHLGFTLIMNFIVY